MKVLITGATGFIGQNLIKNIINEDFEIIAVARNIKEFKNKFQSKIKLIEFDINSNCKTLYDKIGVPDVLIHLAWTGLPNYQNDFHLKKNLPEHKKFLYESIDMGIKQIIVSGTCFEYGKQEGVMKEEDKTTPVTKYGLAKDFLRIELENKQLEKKFILQWVRLFYMYGPGQNPKSLVPSLNQAITKNLDFFGISDGSLIRDFMSINDICRYLIFLIKNNSLNGVINCCSGKPISLLDFVKKYSIRKNSKIQIISGKYPKVDYEPDMFWGSTNKMLSLPFKFEDEFF